MIRRAWMRLSLLPILIFCTGAGWDDREDATGDWDGTRSSLEQRFGLHIDLDYTSEIFGESSDFSYRGNLDLILTLDTGKLGLFPNGLFFIYGQNGHGNGVSDRLGLLMPISNLEAESFTQLSEFWLHKQLGAKLRFRVGKQDANRDFGNPRFGGNFINSSFGVLPGIPMPSFPTPGLGGVAFVEVAELLEVRGGVFEGAPQIGSFDGSAFSDEAGIFGIVALVLKQNLHGSESGVHQIGVWSHSGTDRSGLFGVYDLFIQLKPQKDHDIQSMQLFVRGGWSPAVREPANEITSYAGGGLTVHGFFGEDNTIGLGAGWAEAGEGTNTFLELFFKVREISWLTIEPNLQIHFTPDGRPVVFGIRSKLKL
jgi:porin